MLGVEANIGALNCQGLGNDSRRQIGVGRSIWRHRVCGETLVEEHWAWGTGQTCQPPCRNPSAYILRVRRDAASPRSGPRFETSPRGQADKEGLPGSLCFNGDSPLKPKSHCQTPSNTWNTFGNGRYARNHEHTRRPVEPAVPCIKSCKSCIHVPQRCPTRADAACAVA